MIEDGSVKPDDGMGDVPPEDPGASGSVSTSSSAAEGGAQEVTGSSAGSVSSPAEPTPSEVEEQYEVQTEPVHIQLPTVYVTSTVTSTVPVAFDYTLLGVLFVVAVLGGAVLTLFKQKPASSKTQGPCADIKERLESKKHELGEVEGGISLQESIIRTLSKKVENKVEDVAKDIVKDKTLGKEGRPRRIVDAAEKVHETYEDTKENLENAEKLLRALMEKRMILTKEADDLEKAYAVCVTDISKSIQLPSKESVVSVVGSLEKKKNALILHGTNGDSKENWFPWLKTELEAQGWSVFVPDLPHSERPSIARYRTFLKDIGWKPNENTVLIGHSSGAVAILGFLQSLPDTMMVKKVVLVGAFEGDLDMENLRELYDAPLDFPLIRTKAKEFILIHSDNDPYCPLSHAEHLAKLLGGKLLIRNGEQHFSVATGGETYRTFPFLLSLLPD